MFVLRHPDPGWCIAAGGLAEQGLTLSAESHANFPLAPGQGRLLFSRQATADHPAWGGVANEACSRAVPWAKILRVSRVGHGLSPSRFAAAAGTLVELAEQELALRLHAELWIPDTASRADLIDALRARGFVRSPVDRMYTHTVLIDLSFPESEIFASFSSTCRRHIRAPAKVGLVCAPLSDPALAARLTTLDDETMRRTGGRVSAIDWPAMIRFATAQPTLAALIGISRPDSDGADALVGYVLSVRHGDTVEYTRAASARPPDLKAPLLYAPAWELMRWGQRQGARWFDFGGITPASIDGGDATGGISDFKHSFRSEDVEVGCEMIYAPSRALDRMARSGSALVARIRRLIGRG